MMDKDILMIYAIAHFHNSEESQIAMGINQLNAAKSKLLVVCQYLFFFEHQPAKASKKLLHMRRVECLLLMKSKAAETLYAGYCETVSMLLVWTAVQVQADVEFSVFSLFDRAHLVPVFSFGENELFKQVANPKGSWLRNVQEKLQKIMGFALPLFHARGVFQYSFGLIPYRQPIHTVGKFPAPFLMCLQMFRNVCC